MKQILYKIVLILLVLPLANHVNGQIIIRFAGDTIMGHTGDGGQATAAEMNQPCSVTRDAAGNIYIGEGNGSVIRKVNTLGVISTFAGTGTSGFSGDGGQATAANLTGVEGMAFDASGNLIFADFANSCIRKIDGSGIISTIAGTPGVTGYSGDGGPATAAKFDWVMNVKLDAAGNIFVSDWLNHVIRKINASGTISTFAGTGTSGYTGDGGPATAAEISLAYGLAFDAAGNLFFIDDNNNCVRKIDGTGVITTVCGNGTVGSSGDGGPATAALLAAPTDLAFDSYGNLFIADRGNGKVRKISTSGIITTVAGTGLIAETGDGGPATAASFNRPFGIYIDSKNNIYTADINGHTVRKIIALPVAAFTPPSGHGCMDSCFNFMSTGICSVDSLRWSIPGMTLSSPTHDTLNACFMSAGIFNVSLYVYNLSGVDTQTSVVTINPPPHPMLSRMFNLFSVPGIYSGYQWYVSGTLIAGATLDSFLASGGMGAPVWVVVDSAGCKGRSDTMFIAEGVPGLEMGGNSFWLAANANGVNLYAAGIVDEPINISIFDLTGRKVYGDIWNKGSNSKHIGDLAIPSGMYIVRLSNRSVTGVLKWMK